MWMTNKDTQPISFSDLINCWSSVSAFATELECEYQTARKMKDRNSIAPHHWRKLVEISQCKGIVGVNIEWLASLTELNIQEPAE